MTNILCVITSLPSFSCKMEGDRFHPFFTALRMAAKRCFRDCFFEAFKLEAMRLQGAHGCNNFDHATVSSHCFPYCNYSVMECIMYICTAQKN